MSKIALLLFALLAFALAAPGAAARDVDATLYLHELYRDDAYVGCHVTNTEFATLRLVVDEGDEVTLFVLAPEENQNAHTLQLENGEQVGPLEAGGSAQLSFTAGAPGSRSLVCDGEDDPSLRGSVLVREAEATGGGGGNETPGPAAWMAALAAGAAVLMRRRGAA